VFHLLYRSDGRLLRRIHYDYHGSDDAIEASNFADKTESFLQENGRQDGSNDDRQRSKRRDQNSIDKGIGDKVADLSDNHQRHPRPPVSILEISIAFTRLFVVFCIGLEKARFLQYKRGANEDT
jgi:hypothetical protein